MFKELVKDKKKLGILIGITVIVIVVIILIIVFMNNNNIFIAGSNDNEKIRKEYEELNNVESEDGKIYPKVELPKDNRLVYTNVNEVINIFKNKDAAVIYFGYSTCLYCRSAIEILCNVAKDTNLDKIYYLDVEEETERYDELLNILGEEFIVKDDSGAKLYVPLVVFIVNGSIVSYNKGTLFSQEDPYVELDNFQAEGLSEIYRYGIYDVLEGKAT